MKQVIIMLIMLGLMIVSCSKPESEVEKADSTGTVKGDLVIESRERGIPVEAYVVKNKKIEEKVPFTTLLKPHHSVDIISEASGKVVKINKELGDSVRENDVLAMIDDVVANSNYKQAQAQVFTAENNLKIAQLNLTSDKQLFENGDISKLAYDNSVLAVKTAEANHLGALANFSFMEKQYKDTRIKSPINGIVSRKFIDLGDMVNPTMPVYRVIDLDYLKLEIGVPQASISNVDIGDEAHVTISAINNQFFTGRVKYISPQADEKTGAFMTEIHVENTVDNQIRAGMTAKVDLIMKTEQNKLIIPNYALVSKNDKQFVYKITDETAKLIPIVSGESYGSQLVITEGLNEEDIIVVVGMKNLGTETKVWIESLHNE